MAWLARSWPWLCAIASGIFLALGFPPFNQDWIIWVALTPLTAAVFLSPPRQGRARHLYLPLALGWVTGLVHFYITFFWLTTVTVIGWIALIPYLALYPAAWAWLISIALRPPADVSRGNHPWLRSRHNLWIGIAAGLVWAATEWLRGYIFTGFGWNGLGVAMVDNLAIIQIASITGVGGLSALIVMVNVIAVITVKRLTLEVGRVALRPHYDFSLTIALVVLCFTCGLYRLRDQTPTTSISFAAVQANILQHQKWDPKFEDFILERYSNLTKLATASEPDLLLWPEAATPGSIFSNLNSRKLVTDVAGAFAGDFVMGTLDFDAENDFNSVYLFSENASVVQNYRKVHLVPFGEYIPFRNSFPLFAWIIGDLIPVDFTPGEETKVFHLSTGGLDAAPLICFEDTVPRLVRRFAKQDINLMINITNDGWFKKSSGSVQHLANAVFRSAETGIPLVRVANTGVTCVVDRFGDVTHKLTLPEAGTFVDGVLSGVIDVPTDPDPTFHTRYGEVFSWFACGFTLLLAVLGIRNYRKTQL